MFAVTCVLCGKYYFDLFESKVHTVAKYKQYYSIKISVISSLEICSLNVARRTNVVGGLLKIFVVNEWKTDLDILFRNKT
jgi:hypothetical protein